MKCNSLTNNKIHSIILLLNPFVYVYDLDFPNIENAKQVKRPSNHSIIKTRQLDHVLIETNRRKINPGIGNILDILNIKKCI